MYVARKTEWLKANGWDVQVYYTDYGPVYIDTLKPYKKNHVKELLLPFEIASTKTKKKVEKELERIENE